jgi:serine protease Do
MSTRKTTVFYAALIAIASVAVGMVIASQWGLPQASSAQTINVPVANTAALNGPIDAQTFRNIAKAQSPTVVNIRTTARVRGRELTEFFGGNDDLLQRFFGQGQGQGRQRRAPRDNDIPQQEGTGTGFIIDKSGFILTNNHVVEGADDIRVSLFGGGRAESYAAKVIGRDSLTDTALIQLTEMPAAQLQEARFGDSAQMQPGDWVVAIGNPFNLSHTVTVGVISALGRPLGGVPGREQPMLQTDAAINPGNSGGPLLNVRGEVVGINTAIYTDARQQGNIGIGFAMPINIVRDLLPQLRTGKITRGRIGVSVGAVPANALDEFGLKERRGALVATVDRTGPAAAAGMEPGDVIVEFNGKPVKNNNELVQMVVTTKPGTTVPVKVLRDKQEKTLNVKIDELNLEDEGTRSSRRGGDEQEEEATSGFGMTLSNITPDLARRLRLEDDVRGAVIVDVDQGSPAARAGLAAGDIITRVNRRPVTNVSEAGRELAKVSSGGTAFLLVLRNGQETFVTVTKE